MATNKNGSGLNNPVNESQGGTNAPTFAQARTNMGLAHTFNPQAGNYLALATDLNKFLHFTGAGPYTLSLTPAGTLGTQWQTTVRNDTASNLTIDPDAGEFINGALTLTVEVGQAVTITCDGTGFYTAGQAAAVDGANQALSNLTNPTSVNQDLIPSAPGKFLGDPALPWTSIFTVGTLAAQAAGSESALGAYDGNLLDYKAFFTVTSAAPGNPATGVIASAVTGTTQAAATNTDQIATCAFVLANAGAGSVPSARTIEIDGTANEITSSAGAQDLSANRTWTLSLPAALTFTGKTITGGAYSGASATTFTFTTGSIGTAVTGVTQIAGTNNTTLATTAFVTAAVAAGGTVTSVSGTANRITSSGGATPVIDIAATYVGQASITTLGTVTTGTWNGTVIDLAHGGTNANLTASNGGIFYSTAGAGAILAGTATARQMLQSGASTTPAWSTATYPATTTINRLLYSSAANVISDLATANSGILVTSAGGVPSIGTAIPNGVTATSQAFGTSDTTLATTAFTQGARIQVVNAQTVGYTLAASDQSKVVRYTGAGGVTVAITAAATLANGWFTTLRNDSTGILTVDPNGAELINGASTLALAPGGGITIWTDGSTFYTIGQLNNANPMSWSEETTTSRTAAVNTGIICNNAGLVTITLPSVAPLGSIVALVGKGAGLWKVGQPASAQIQFGDQVTTNGTGGSLQAINQYDCVELICITANTTWAVRSSMGNITFV
jgi:hypothetical protein